MIRSHLLLTIKIIHNQYLYYLIFRNNENILFEWLLLNITNCVIYVRQNCDLCGGTTWCYLTKLERVMSLIFYFFKGITAYIISKF